MSHLNTRLTVEERFEMKVDRSGECHRWTGAHHGDGYGHFRYEGKVRKAHVVALLLAGVEIPAGMTVDHVWARGCKHKDCVRIDHLEVVTNRENTLRGNNLCAQNARKTHCSNGHPLTPDNLRPNVVGRLCITCHRASSRITRERRRAQKAATA
jgi:hypothetical protein